MPGKMVIAVQTVIAAMVIMGAVAEDTHMTNLSAPLTNHHHSQRDHLVFAAVLIVVSGLMYHYSQKGSKNSETMPLTVRPPSSIFARFAYLAPHAYVTASALMAAVMSMEAGIVQEVGMPAACLALIATCAASVMLIVGLAITKKFRFSEDTERPWTWHIVQGVLSGNTPLMAFYAIPRIGLSQACALMFTMPLWTAFFAAVVFRRSWGRAQVALSVILAVGVILVLQPEPIFGNGSPPELDGVLSALGFAIFNAGAVLVTNEKLRSEDPSLLSLFAMSFGAVCSAVLYFTGALPGLDGAQTVNSVGSATTIFQAVLVGGLLTWMNVLRSAGFCQAKDSIVANLLYLEIFFANVLDIFIVHGHVNVLSVVGSATILIGSIVSSLL